MTSYQKLEELQKLEAELYKWKCEFKNSVVSGSGTIFILEELITKIVILKIDLGIKIKL